MDIESLLSNGVSSSNAINEENSEKILNIHIQQLGRKCITTLFGIEQLDCDLNKLKSKFSSHFSCSCSIKTAKDGDYIGQKYFKLSGDQRGNIKEYLLYKKYITDDDKVIIFGA